MSNPRITGPWWVTLLEHDGRRWLLRFKFDAAGSLAELHADALDHQRPAPTGAMIAAAERFRSRNLDIIAEARRLAAGDRPAGVYAGAETYRAIAE